MDNNEKMDPFTRAMLKQREHAELKVDEFTIRVDDMIQTLDVKNTLALRELMSGIVATSQEVPHLAAHYEGFLAARLQYKFGVCMSCAKVHDDGGSVDEAVDGILGDANRKAKAEALKPDFVQGTLFEVDKPTDSAIESIYANAEQYGVTLVDFSNPLGPVTCDSCGVESVSLEDRMLREPGVKGCGACQQKAKWG